jgi:anti-sigma factor RsiW
MPAELIVMTAEDVSAFVDGELGRDERQDVAACARDDDRVACLIAAWQWQQGLLHVAYGALTDEPVPVALLPQRTDPGRGHRR